jgi:hypothetical protein
MAMEEWFFVTSAAQTKKEGSNQALLLAIRADSQAALIFTAMWL